MSVLMVGMSHKSAPIEVLERAALDTDAAVKLSHQVLDTPTVTESVVVSTCNRVEVYVEADRFHGSVDEVSRLLAEHAGLGRDELVQHVYVHYDDAAVAHLGGQSTLYLEDASCGSADGNVLVRGVTDEASTAAIGKNVLDPAARPPSARAGYAQAAAEVARVRALWA